MNVMRYVLMSVVAVCAISGVSVHALSCVAPLPTFEQMKSDAEIVVRGTVTAHTIRNRAVTTSEHCPQTDIARELGTHVYTIQIEKVLAGRDRVTTQTIELTREVTGLHCTRGGACLDMEVGQSYVILADEKKRIMDGLCKTTCPYMTVRAYDAIYNPKPIEPLVCPTGNYDPVCGKNGVTYASSCIAKQKRVTIAYAGECQCVVTKEYAPVCGVDGVTYDNYSAARCKNIRVNHEGVCRVSSTDPQTPPANCTSRFDGCNTCAVGPDNALNCTRIACIEKQQPQCLAYRYTYLTSTQEKAIEQAVPGIIKNIGATELRKRVAKLRHEVEYTLSTSTFIKDSPELREHLLILELLQKIETLI